MIVVEDSIEMGRKWFCLEAAPRFELGIKVLQTSALPLGHGAILVPRVRFELTRPKRGTGPSSQRVCRSTTWARRDIRLAVRRQQV